MWRWCTSFFARKLLIINAQIWQILRIRSTPVPDSIPCIEKYASRVGTRTQPAENPPPGLTESLALKAR